MAKKQPDDLAKFLGHAVVGLGAMWLAGKLTKAAVPAIVIGVVGIILHAELDAPVAQAFSELGI